MLTNATGMQSNPDVENVLEWMTPADTHSLMGTLFRLSPLS